MEEEGYSGNGAFQPSGSSYLPVSADVNPTCTLSQAILNHEQCNVIVQHQLQTQALHWVRISTRWGLPLMQYAFTFDIHAPSHLHTFIRRIGLWGVPRVQVCNSLDLFIVPNLPPSVIMIPPRGGAWTTRGNLYNLLLPAREEKGWEVTKLKMPWPFAQTETCPGFC